MYSETHPRKNGKKVNGSVLVSKADDHIKVALAAVDEGLKDSLKTREALKRIMEMTDTHDQSLIKKT